MTESSRFTRPEVIAGVSLPAAYGVSLSPSSIVSRATKGSFEAREIDGAIV